MEGFRIVNGVGTATISNSPKYKLGDVILRFTATNPKNFIGKQMCTDGVFRPVSGTLVNDVSLDLVVFRCGPIQKARSKMLKTDGSPPDSAAASEEPESTLAAAESGELWAQCALGASYLGDQDKPRNVGEALKWFNRAADAGYLEAQLAIGDMYYGGDGVPEDRSTALSWFRRVADEADRPTPPVSTMWCTHRPICKAASRNADPSMKRAVAWIMPSPLWTRSSSGWARMRGSIQKKRRVAPESFGCASIRVDCNLGNLPRLTVPA